jgi:quercetin dioxygenase-like cupin family protein
MEATLSSNVVRIGAMELRFRVDETQSDGSLVMFEFAVPPRARVPAPHYHEAADEAVFGLEGTLTTTVAGRAHAVGPGDVVFIPRGQVHHHANLHDTATARALIVITPGTIGRRYFEEIAEATNDRAGPPYLERLMAIMRRHGLDPA